ncbi:hypothetical protein N9L22_01785 [Candidatus Poseidonia alphae]|nr:hypothetical protein [Candidatus Poseidonia alphae]
MGIKQLIGFSDSRVGYSQTKQMIQFDGRFITSTSNGKRFDVGEFEFLTLAELRSRFKAHQSDGDLPKFDEINRVYHNKPSRENVQEYMRNTEYNCALFQVASQFNLLEMGTPQKTPEDGVDIYWRDPTQGPACATATIGATLFRNYFIEHGGFVGQTADQQINGLRDMLTRLGLREEESYLYENGYVRLSKEDTIACSKKIKKLSEEERFELMGELSVGIHWGCQVNNAETGLEQRVSLILCSGLPLGGYARPGVNLDDAEALGRLVQDGMQEATILAGALNQIKFGVSDVVLTKLGNGVFGNPVDWVVAARNRALDLVPCSLDVLQFHFSRREPEFDY